MYRLILILIVFPPRTAQPAGITAVNVLRNSDASAGMRFWKADGSASIEQVGGDPCFVLRRGGFFRQTVSISEGHESLYVVFVGRVLSEYVHADGAITDRPYLYGLALGESERILGYLQGDTMRGGTETPQKWETVYGVFHVPDGTTRIQFELGQGLRKGVPYTGAAARFDDLALYAVTDESSARAIAARHATDARIKLGTVTFPVRTVTSRRLAARPLAACRASAAARKAHERLVFNHGRRSRRLSSQQPASHTPYPRICCRRGMPGTFLYLFPGCM